DLAVPIDIFVEVTPGETLRARFALGGEMAEVRSSVPVAEAKSIPLTAASLKMNLGRLGETGFELNEFNANIAGPGFLPQSIINEVRRQGVAALQEKLRNPSSHASSAEFTRLPLQRRRSQSNCESALGIAGERVASAPTELSVLARTREQVAAAVEAGIPRIY